MPTIVTGVIKWFNPHKGYGFVLPDDGGSDVMIHMTFVRKSGFADPPPEAGDEIEVEAREGRLGRQATKILTVNGKPPPARTVFVDRRTVDLCAERLDGAGLSAAAAIVRDVGRGSTRG